MITTYQIGASNLNKYKPIFQNKSIQTFDPKSSNSILAITMLGNNSAFYDVSDDGDTIELSKQGVEKSKNFMNNQMTDENANTNTNASTNESNTRIANKPLNANDIAKSNDIAKANDITQTTVDTESSEEDPTDLTSYTAYELSQLLAKGTITSAEYFAEIARRDELKKLNLA